MYSMLALKWKGHRAHLMKVRRGLNIGMYRWPVHIKLRPLTSMQGVPYKSLRYTSKNWVVVLENRQSSPAKFASTD